MSKLSKVDNTPLINPFSRLSRFQKILLIIGLILLILVALPAILILAVGLLPSLTLLFTDRRNTAKLIIVGGFNLAGVFICLMDVFNQFDINQAWQILSNIFNLIIMLGSAALGMIVYYELPSLFIGFSKMSSEKRLDTLNNKLNKLSEEWGRDLINNGGE